MYKNWYDKKRIKDLKKITGKRKKGYIDLFGLVIFTRKGFYEGLIERNTNFSLKKEYDIYNKIVLDLKALLKVKNIVKKIKSLIILYEKNVKMMYDGIEWEKIKYD
jgi:hypothetical protein